MIWSRVLRGREPAEQLPHPSACHHSLDTTGASTRGRCTYPNQENQVPPLWQRRLSGLDKASFPPWELRDSSFVVLQKRASKGFPGGSVVKNSPAKAGDMGSISDPERSIGCRATKPVCHNCWACALEPGTWNHQAFRPQLLWSSCPEPVLHRKRSYCTTAGMYWARESPQAAMKTQHTQTK